MATSSITSGSKSATNRSSVEQKEAESSMRSNQQRSAADSKEVLSNINKSGDRQSVEIEGQLRFSKNKPEYLIRINKSERVDEISSKCGYDWKEMRNFECPRTTSPKEIVRSSNDRLSQISNNRGKNQPPPNEMSKGEQSGQNLTSDTQQTGNNYKQHNQSRQINQQLSCTAQTLVSEADESLPRIKQHQPHCLHFASNCQRRQLRSQQLTFHNKHHQQDHHRHDHHHHHHHQTGRLVSAGQQQQQPTYDDGNIEAGAPLPAEASRKFTKSKPDKYLLVEYRQGEFHQILDESRSTKQPHNLKLPKSNEKLAHTRELLRQQQQQQLREQQRLINNGRANLHKRSTVKFISQLYFLFHLSAVLSLLLHHKNLVISERKQALAARHPSQQANEAKLMVRNEDFNQNNNVKRQTSGSALNSGLSVEGERKMIFQTPAKPGPGTLGSGVLIDNLLPVPQMLQSSSTQRSPPGTQSKIINSVLINHHEQLAQNSTSPNNRFKSINIEQHVSNSTKRFARQSQQHYAYLPSSGSRDILIELIGYWHAKFALQYLLTYLLLSSMAILIFIRLSSYCGFRKRLDLEERTLKALAKSDSSSDKTGTSDAGLINSSNNGFYYRTRLDCTPVLIGSISLGLIQLIVIGLDIATNFDLLGADGRRSIYLPFLQFAFVSLLMQFILGKVAKNNKRKEESFALVASKVSGEQQACGSKNLSIKNDSRRRVYKRNKSRQLETIANGPGEWNEIGQGDCSASISGGLQNIALAHLLVTHILLWLMKLNSISLFHSIEQQESPYLFQDPLHSQQHYNRKQAAIANQPAVGGADSKLPVNYNRLASANKQPQPPQQGQTESGINALPPAVDVGWQSAAPPSVETAHSTNSNVSANERDADADRHNRAELESILRRKFVAGPVESGGNSRPPSHSSDADNQKLWSSKSSLPSNEFSLANDLLSKKNASIERIHSTLKSERDLSSSTAKENSTAASEPREIKLVNVNETTISMSHAQLINLLNLAAKNQKPTAATTTLDLDTSLASKLGQNSPKFQQTTNNSGGEPQLLGPVAVKSSLPKRMTAFRQASLATTAATSKANGPSNLSGENSITTPLPAIKTPAPKQTARVFITRTNNLLSAPELERKLPLGNSLRSSNLIAATERPFPSVDVPGREKAAAASQQVSSKSAQLDIKRPISVRKEKLDEAIYDKNEDDYEDQAAKSARAKSTGSAKANSNLLRPTANEPSIGADETEAADSGEEPPASDSEDSELDLDSLLPPVPNYTDASEDSEAAVKKESTNETSPSSSAGALRKPRVVRDRDEKKTITSRDLSGESLAFNEAATSVAPTITPAIGVIASNEFNSSKSKTVEVRQVIDSIDGANNSGIVSKKEVLIMASALHYEDQFKGAHDHHDGESRNSFADFLLPIVHQYHILIIAILFNMWLDSLKQENGYNDWKMVENQANERMANSCYNHGRNMKFLKREPLNNNGKIITTTSSGTENEFSTLDSRYLAELELKMVQSRRQRAMAEHSAHLKADCRHRSQSMNSLHELNFQKLLNHEANQSDPSTLSRYNSLRSSSSHRLLCIPSSQLKAQGKWLSTMRSQLGSETPDSSRTNSYLIKRSRELINCQANYEAQQARNADILESAPNSVCCVFFGLLIVSASLIVILIGIDLLSVLTQCLAQLISILICLLGLCFIWRSRVKGGDQQGKLRRRVDRNKNFFATQSYYHKRLGEQKRFALVNSDYLPNRKQQQLQQFRGQNHRQFFHYLFLLAAYYCGISIALNLSDQYSAQQFFTKQVIQFCQRHMGQWFSHWLMLNQTLNYSQDKQHQQPNSPANYLLLFHILLALKGLLLVLQVTLQTVLIRFSSQRVTKELRQIYTFLMFANLSLWAMEICEQQQQHYMLKNLEVLEGTSDAFKLITLESFTRFAASIVTLSHLYHGLVFMQH